MKILFITHKFYPDIGGIEVNSEILSLSFHQAGHEIRLITWSKDPGQKQYPFPVLRNPGLFTLLRLHNWADAVFENNLSLKLSWPSFFLKKPRIVAIRTWINRMDGTTGWQDKLKIKSLKKASAVIAISEAVRKRTWPAATVIGNPYRSELFKILPNIPKTIDFVFLGRLVSDKGADIAINAIAKLSNKFKEDQSLKSNFCLTIIGDGPELAILKKLTNDLNIQSQVDFKGWVKGQDLVALLNQHRFILIPSIWEEPFGNVALEGMACGCVPVVSDGGGLVDAVGNAGITCKRGDVNSLAESIMKVLNDPRMEDDLRRAANDHLKEHYPTVVSQKYLRVIENVMNV